MLRKYAALAALIVGLTGTASAAPVTSTFNFIAGPPFTAAFGNPVPYPVVTGSFTLTYDLANVGSEGVITVSSISIPYSGTARYIVYGSSNLGFYTTDYFDSATNTFTFGVNGFAGTLNNLAPPPGTSAGTFNYSQIGFPDYASTRTVLLTPSVTDGVPEPATWATTIAGFGIVGGAVRRRGASLTFA